MASNVRWIVPSCQCCWISCHPKGGCKLDATHKLAHPSTEGIVWQRLCARCVVRMGEGEAAQPL